MRNVAFLNFDPLRKTQATVPGILQGVLPNRLGQHIEHLVGHVAKTADNLERLARALVKVAQTATPLHHIECHDLAIGLGDKTPAHFVGANFAVREMQNNFVNAPALD